MDRQKHWGQREHQGSRLFFGTVVVIIGVFFLLRGLFPQAFYGLNTQHLWPVILIIVGVGIGIKHRFRNAAAWILIAVGGFYLAGHAFWEEIPKRVFWPSLLIIFGLMIILKRNKPRFSKLSDCQPMFTNGSDVLNIDISFSGRKEIVTSKHFQGGVIRASFAGAEVNLAGADSETQPMVLELHANFAGIELIVPSHWEVRNEINTTMGSVEDLRVIRTPDTTATPKLLILKGSCSFGSIELKSY